MGSGNWYFSFESLESYEYFRKYQWNTWCIPQGYLMASTRACLWNISPLFWKFPWCIFNTICETKGSWSTRAVYSRLILSNHCNKFDALWCFQIYKIVNFIFSNNYIFYQTHSVHPPTPVSAGRGWTSCQIFKKDRGARQDLNFERGLLEKREITFFRRGCNFYKKIN